MTIQSSAQWWRLIEQNWDDLVALFRRCGLAGELEGMERLKARRDARIASRLLAAQKYAQSVQAELDKVRLKLATILDVITLTERWDAARLNAIAARANHAVALARYRFETGTLVQAGATLESPLTVEDLTTLPPAEVVREVRLPGCRLGPHLDP